MKGLYRVHDSSGVSSKVSLWLGTFVTFAFGGYKMFAEQNYADAMMAFTLGTNFLVILEGYEGNMMARVEREVKQFACVKTGSPLCHFMTDEGKPELESK